MKKHVLICGLGILLGFLLNTGVLAAANSSIGPDRAQTIVRK